MEICFRKAVRDDFPAINALFQEMLCTIYHKDNAEGYKPGDLDYYFSGGEDWICVAEIEGQLAGFLSIEVHREEQNYLYYDDFSVSGQYRGRGIGAQLMDRAEEYCRALGFDAIVLHVEKGNAGARRLYEKRGFALLRDDGDRLCLCKRLRREPC